VRKFEWKHAAIIYNSKTNLKKVRCLLGAPDQTRPKLDISLNIANTQYDYRPILRDISKRSIRNIILDLEPDEAQVVLKMALQLGMINSTYHYIMTSLDVETLDLEDFKYNRANLTSLRLIKTDSNFYRTIALNLSDYSNQISKTEFERQKILLKTKNALIFDATYTFTMAVKEAERTLTLSDGFVSCQENKPLKYGHLLNSYVERVFALCFTVYTTHFSVWKFIYASLFSRIF
jgi:ionotropic kainate glutamate receptor 2